MSLQNVISALYKIHFDEEKKNRSLIPVSIRCKQHQWKY